MQHVAYITSKREQLVSTCGSGHKPVLVNLGYLDIRGILEAIEETHFSNRATVMSAFERVASNWDCIISKDDCRGVPSSMRLREYFIAKASSIATGVQG